ncbi:solute carrier family 9 member A4, partial [Chelydra serpentina]
PSYNRHNLPTETSEKQTKEILIRRQNSLRQSVRKGNSLPWGKPASTKNVRFLSLPHGTHNPARRKARHDASTGDYSSDSDSVVSTIFSPQLRAGSLGANRHQQEMVPMERLARRDKLSGFAGQRGTPSKQDHTARIRRPALMPKPQFDAVFEEEIQGYESEEEEGAVAASRPSVKWTAEKRNVRHFHKAPTPPFWRK